MKDAAIVTGSTDYVALLESVKPGAHVVMFAEPALYARVATAVEDAGFEVRDSLNIALGAGPHGQPVGHMLAVMARKPFVGTVITNVLTHGVGGLNIDRCRVAHQSEADLKESEGKNRHADFGTEPGGNAIYGDYSMVPRTNYSGSGGRWPANSIYVHDVDCHPVGTVEDTFGGGAQATSGFVNGYAHDGFVGETVQSVVWACAPACPVKNLNSQSGKSTSAGGKHSGRKGTRGSVGGYGHERVEISRPTDSGGASRYFINLEWSPKDTGSLPAALYAYLQRLITPEGGTCVRIH